MTPAARRRLAAGLLAGALTLHDLEEAVGYPLMRAAIAEILPRAPAVETVWAALAAVTLAGVGVTAWAGLGPASPAKATALRVIALILLVNVVIPHVPAAVVLGGYAPGVLTALALNLPIGFVALRLLRA